MAHINLLPWREQARQTQKKQYIASLIALSACVALIFFFVGKFIEEQIRYQHSRNNYLKQQIQMLDKQIEEIQKIHEAKEAITIRMSLIEQLQVSRNLSAIIFDELVSILPPGVSFNRLSRTEKSIKITGISESNNRLSDFMRAIEQSAVFIDPVLSSVIADRTGTKAYSDFELKFTIAPKYFPSEATETQLANR